MEFKLFRVMNLFSRSFLKSLPVLAVLLLFFGIVGSWGKSVGETVVSLSVVVILFLAVFLSTTPGRLRLDGEQISYSEWGSRKRHFASKTASIFNIRYVITSVREIELFQNSIEKQLGMGHVRIHGYASGENQTEESVPSRSIHTVYGISDFKSFEQQITAVFGDRVVDKRKR